MIDFDRNGGSGWTEIRIPYELLWGKAHALGFHESPWGPPHTPARGLELVNLYFLRLQSNLFELPVPSLLGAIGALALARRVRSFDRYWLWTAALVVLFYFAYWHDGIFLGPRFVLVLAPALALWTARFPVTLREAFPRTPAVYRGVVFALVVALALGVGVSIPYRARMYASDFRATRVDFGAMARANGARDAIVLVRESWGAQLIARLWALGVSRSDTERIYRAVDACQLEGAISDLEARGIRGQDAFRQLQPMRGDSLRLVREVLSPDRTLRSLPGASYGEVCQARLRDDRAGFTVLASALALPRDGNVYARDLQARDTLLLRANPGRPVYLIRPTSSELNAPLMMERLSADSLAGAWGTSLLVGSPIATGSR